MNYASVMSNSLQPYGLYPSRLLCPWDSPGKNTGVAFHALLQGIFLTQGLNPHLLRLPHLQVGYLPLGFPGGSAGKESACNAGDLGLIPGLGRSPGGGKGSPLQYSGLENSMDRIGWKGVGHEGATST